MLKGGSSGKPMHMEPKTEPKPPKEPEIPAQESMPLPGDLERCPRCGFEIENILWGKTNCPNCGLHFECC